MKIKFKVTGMTCSACQSHVERAAASVDGVHNVVVNLLSNSMTLEADSMERAAEVSQAVKKAGYTAEPMTEGAAPAQSAPQDSQKEQIAAMK